MYEETGDFGFVCRRCWISRPAKRYEKSIPGERVQMDTMKIGEGLYKYTAVDGCSRFLVVGVYPRGTAVNTLLFLVQELLHQKQM